MGFGGLLVVVCCLRAGVGGEGGVVAAENHAAVNLFRKSGLHLEKVTQERYGDRLCDMLHMYRLLNTAL